MKKPIPYHTLICNLNQKMFEEASQETLDSDFGIEIECEGVNLPKKLYSKSWSVHEDNSLRGESAEYVTTPLKYGECVKALEYLSHKLNDKSVTVLQSHRTSVHVHMNCLKNTFLEVVNIVTLFSIVEDFLIQWCGKDRVGNLFCLSNKESVGLKEYICQILQGDRDLKDIIIRAQDDIRYAALNLASLGKYGTLEFRSLEGTTDVGRILTWINILYELRNTALKFESPRAIIESFSVNTPDDFIKKLCFPETHHHFYTGNIQVLKKGVRFAQDIAYVVPNWIVDRDIVKPSCARFFSLKRPSRPRGLIEIDERLLRQVGEAINPRIIQNIPPQPLRFQHERMIEDDE